MDDLLFPRIGMFQEHFLQQCIFVGPLMVAMFASLTDRTVVVVPSESEQGALELDIA